MEDAQFSSEEGLRDCERILPKPPDMVIERRRVQGAMKPIIHFCMAAPYSGLSILQRCFRVLDLVERKGQYDVVTINEHIFSTFAVPSYAVGSMPTAWIDTKQAAVAQERIVNLLREWTFKKNIYFLCDTRFCQTLPMWRRALLETEYEAKYTLLLRHPWETALSLAKHCGYDLNTGHAIWLTYTRNVIAALRQVPYGSVTFDQLLADPLASLRQILGEKTLSRLSGKHQDGTRRPLSDFFQAILDLVQPSLRHSHASNFPDRDKEVFAGYACLYEQLCRAQAERKLRTDGCDDLNCDQTLFLSGLIDPLLELLGQFSRKPPPAPAKPLDSTLVGRMVFTRTDGQDQFVRSFAMREEKWQKISIILQEVTTYLQYFLRIIPLNVLGTVLISDIQFIEENSSKIIWRMSAAEFQNACSHSNDVLFVSDSDQFAMLITGKDPWVLLKQPLILSEQALRIEFWVKPYSEMKSLIGVNGNNIQVMMPVALNGKDHNDDLLLLNQGKFIARLNDLSFGAISECIFYSKLRKVFLRGWFLPACLYDEINIYDNNNVFLGKAKRNFPRKDVYIKYKFFNELYSGWEFCGVVPEDSEIEYLQVVFLRDNISIKEMYVSPKVDASNSNCPSIVRDIKIIPSVDWAYINEISIMYSNKKIISFNIDIEKKSSFKYFIENMDIQDIISGIELQVKNGDGVVNTIRPIFDMRSDIDSQLINDICADVREDTSNFFKSYIVSNYQRIYNDVKIITQAFTNATKILDIGSIPPLLAGLLHKRGYNDITLLDPNIQLCHEYLSMNGIKSVEGTVWDLERLFPREQFDLVILCEVFEHLSGDLLQFGEQLSRVCATHASLYVTTPNLRSVSGLVGLGVYQTGLASKHGDTIRQQYDKLKSLGYLGHVREYTEKEIVDFFKSFGFAHVRTHYQPEYRRAKDFYSKITFMLESMFPEFCLFTKYIFKKI